MNIEIRREREEDYFDTEAMVRRAFFNKFESGCNEHLMVHTMRTSPLYLKEFSRVAVVDGHVAGTIMYFMAKIVAGDREINVPSFGPLCVEHKYKNHGIGSMLLEETLPLVKVAGYPGVIIMGEPQYYPKHGFVRAGSLGLTTADGNVFDAFMAIEFQPGALRISEGRFIEPEELCEFSDKAVSEFDKKFEFREKAIRPCQWGYQNASDEKQGYHLEYAMMHPGKFNELFKEYLEELALETPSLKDTPLEDYLTEIWEDVNVAAYVICVGNDIAGLFVSSVPEKKVAAGEAESYLQEIYVSPGFRCKGIAKDIFLRFIGQQTANTGFCMVENSNAGRYWTGLLRENGYDYQISKEDEDRVFCKVIYKAGGLL